MQKFHHSKVRPTTGHFQKYVDASGIGPFKWDTTVFADIVLIIEICCAPATSILHKLKLLFVERVKPVDYPKSLALLGHTRCSRYALPLVAKSAVSARHAARSAPSSLLSTCITKCSRTASSGTWCFRYRSV